MTNRPCFAGAYLVADPVLRPRDAALKTSQAQ